MKSALFQTIQFISLVKKCEECNEIDGAMHECCKECAKKKQKIRTVTNLEEAEWLDANDNNLQNSNEGSTTITNQQTFFKVSDAPILCYYDECDKLDEEGSTTVFDECYEVLEKNG